MGRKITQQQFTDLWFEEFAPTDNVPGCMICGGSGVLDTRGKVFNGHGVDVGGRAACICPNGRAIRRHVVKAQKDEVKP